MYSYSCLVAALLSLLPAVLARGQGDIDRFECTPRPGALNMFVLDQLTTYEKPYRYCISSQEGISYKSNRQTCVIANPAGTGVCFNLENSAEPWEEWTYRSYAQNLRLGCGKTISDGAHGQMINSAGHWAGSVYFFNDVTKEDVCGKPNAVALKNQYPFIAGPQNVNNYNWKLAGDDYRWSATPGFDDPTDAAYA